MESMRREFLDILVKKGGLRIARDHKNLFTLKSGRASPVFINLGVLTDGESLSALKRAYATSIASLLKQGTIDKVDFIFGPAYKGIGLALLACEGLYELYGIRVRYLYDRKEEKLYGDAKMDEVVVGGGYLTEGAKILLVDDVITTGATKLDALEKLQVLGNPKIVGLLVAVDRQEKTGDAVCVGDSTAADNIRRQGIPVFAILNMQEIFQAIKDSLSKELRKTWIEYYDKYGAVKLPD